MYCTSYIQQAAQLCCRLQEQLSRTASYITCNACCNTSTKCIYSRVMQCLLQSFNQVYIQQSNSRKLEIYRREKEGQTSSHDEPAGRPQLMPPYAIPSPTTPTTHCCTHLKTRNSSRQLRARTARTLKHSSRRNASSKVQLLRARRRLVWFLGSWLPCFLLPGWFYHLFHVYCCSLRHEASTSEGISAASYRNKRPSSVLGQAASAGATRFIRRSGLDRRERSTPTTEK